jgi:hypothetical protein
MLCNCPCVVVSVLLSSPMYPLFCHCRHPCPVCSHFVHDGSAPPALATVVADNLRFGRAVGRRRQRRPRGRASSSGGQSVPNTNCTMTSLSCSSSLLVSVIVGVVLPKCPSQSWRSATSKKSHVYVGVVVILRRDAVAVVAHPILPPNEPRRHRSRASTSSRSPYSSPPSPRRPPSLQRSSRGGSLLPG